MALDASGGESLCGPVVALTGAAGGETCFAQRGDSECRELAPEQEEPRQPEAHCVILEQRSSFGEGSGRLEAAALAGCDSGTPGSVGIWAFVAGGAIACDSQIGRAHV